MAKHKYIETPEALLDLFESYKLDLRHKQPLEWKEWQYVGKDGNRVEDTLKVPMTMEGFRRFGYDKGVTIKHYFDNQKGAYDDYCTICSRISNEIREDQIIGGLLGKYNPSITQRLNGLREQSEVTTKTEQPLFGGADKEMD